MAWHIFQAAIFVAKLDLQAGSWSQLERGAGWLAARSYDTHKAGAGAAAAGMLVQEKLQSGCMWPLGSSGEQGESIWDPGFGVFCSVAVARPCGQDGWDMD